MLKKITKWTAVFFIIGLIILTSLEVILRYTLPASHSVALPQKMIDDHIHAQAFRYDPDLMWYWKVLPQATTGLNAVGFRRRKAMQRSKPAGITRVIAFGDSQTYGGGVAAEESFSYFAEESLGSDWEILNAGISGYRSLNIFRLMRLKMLQFQADIFVVNCMAFDSPAENGDLHQKMTGAWQIQVREALWNSRLNYVFQLGLRRAGLGGWEELPWPVHLHKVREQLSLRPRAKDGLGNHQQIARWATERGVRVVFMEYPYRTRDNHLDCLASKSELPEGYPVFRSCVILKKSKHPAEDLFIDSNHLTPLGNKVLGEKLADFLRELPKP